MNSQGKVLKNKSTEYLKQQGEKNSTKSTLFHSKSKVISSKMIKVSRKETINKKTVFFKNNKLLTGKSLSLEQPNSKKGKAISAKEFVKNKGKKSNLFISVPMFNQPEPKVINNEDEDPYDQNKDSENSRSSQSILIEEYDGRELNIGRKVLKDDSFCSLDSDLDDESFKNEYKQLEEKEKINIELVEKELAKISLSGKQITYKEFRDLFIPKEKRNETFTHYYYLRIYEKCLYA